jgi:signal transduction histidine kinase/CheY-like chemotaxis protein
MSGSDETALEIARARYFNLYALAPLPYVTLDRQGVIRDVNLAAATLLRANLGALVGNPLLSVIATEDPEAFVRHLEDVRRTGAPVTTEISLRIGGRQSLILQLVSAPLAEDGGEILTALLDVTERRRGEHVMLFLDRAAMLFGAMTAPRAVIDQVPPLAVPLLGDLCVAELRDGRDGAHAASAHVQLEDARVLKSVEKRFTNLPGIRAAVETALATGAPQVVEHFRTVNARDGSFLESTARLYDRRAVEQLQMHSVMAVPLVGRGLAFGVVVLATTSGRPFRPSDLPLAVELARRAALAIDNGRLFVELQEANQAKDDFLAILSHELRTPLTPVLAAVSAALAHRMPGPGELASTFEMIERNIELERRLIDDLLDVSRITRGQLQLTMETLDAHQAIGVATKICHHDLNQKSIVLTCELAAQRHHVTADSARLDQVLWNILKNAIKFTPPGGSVRVSTHNDTDRIVIEVADTGMGIERKDLGRIFNAFTQADAAMGRRLGGLGLGLSISRSLVHAHGGSIRAESEGRGRGAVFTIELPLARAPVAGIAALSSAEADTRHGTLNGAPIRVLLVEDDVDTLEVTSSLLREFNYEVATAETLASAIDQASTARFDVLVSDINLPDGSGLDLMRQIRSSGNPLQGIALSGFGTQEDVDRAKRAGFAAHLTKPITFPRLESAIGQVFRTAH